MEWKLNVLLSECVAIKKQLKSNNDDRRKSEYVNKTFAPQQNLLSKGIINLVCTQNFPKNQYPLSDTQTNVCVLAR